MTIRPHVAKTQPDTTKIHIVRLAHRNDFLEDRGQSRILRHLPAHLAAEVIRAFLSIGITDAGESKGATWKARMSSFNREATP